VAASDLRRARDSAGVLAAPWAAEVHADPRLREMDFGEWDGHAWDALETRDHARLHAWMAEWVRTRAPGGESFEDVVARVGAWLDERRATEADDATVLAVAHAGSIRAALCHLLGWPLAQAFQARVDHARVTALAVRRDAAELLFLNADRVPQRD
jgi:broad specificity phosphatase PhoE